MKKLTEQRGASILMALLLVLLAVVVSTVILTAAVSAARQLRIDRETQQNYLTVSSAAELVRDSILADCYVRTVEKTETKTEMGTEVSSSTRIQPPDGLLGPWLSLGIDDNGNPKEYTATLYLQVEENKKLGKVKLDFFMSGYDVSKSGYDVSMSDYNVFVVLSLADVSGAADDCRMTLWLEGRPSTVSSTSGGSGSEPSLKTTTQTVKWSNARIEKGG